MFAHGSASPQLFLEVPGCHLLWQMSSWWGSQKLLQGLLWVTAYLSFFNLFTLNELWPYYQKYVNQKIMNHATHKSWALQIFKAIVRILLIVSLWSNGLVVKALDSIQGSFVQNQWVAPRSTQPFILLRSIKWVPGISGNLVVKSKLPPWSGCSLEAVEPDP